LSVLAGHWRYAHMSALRGDGVNPELLASVVTSKPAICGHFKTGHFSAHRTASLITHLPRWQQAFS
jgi:hypothetical protein